MKSYCTPVSLDLAASGLALVGRSNTVAMRADLIVDRMIAVLMMLLHGGKGSQLYTTTFVTELVHTK